MDKTKSHPKHYKTLVQGITWQHSQQGDSLVDEHKLTISVPEAGRRLGLGKNASYEAARRGELPVLRFGRRLRVPVVAFERLLSETKPTAN
jgi:excisionase family DNA binding protein